VTLFKQAADAGSTKAYFNLGVAHQRGAGVAVNLDLAAHWFELDGGAEACVRLAGLWREATPTRAADPAAVRHWLGQGCKGGAVAACHTLAEAAMDRLQHGSTSSRGSSDGNSAGRAGSNTPDDPLNEKDPLSIAIGWLQAGRSLVSLLLLLVLLVLVLLFLLLLPGSIRSWVALECTPSARFEG
jgi:hypothetical protein